MRGRCERRQGAGPGLLAALLVLPQTTVNYPPAHRDEGAGGDPYRWLADLGTDQARAWIRAEDELTRSFLGDTRDIVQRLVPLVDPALGLTAARRGGERVFFARERPGAPGAGRELWAKEDGEDQPHLVWPTADAPALDLADLRPAPDGAHVALALRASPVAPIAWRVLDVEEHELLPGGVGDAGPLGATDLAWLPAGDAALVVAYDEKGSGRVLEHALDDRISDTELYRGHEEPGWTYSLSLSPDGRYVALTERRTDGAHMRVLVLDRDEPRDGFRPLLEDPGLPTSVIHIGDGLVWLRTELDAPRGRVLVIDLSRPEHDAWANLVEQENERLLGGRSQLGGLAPIFAGDRFLLPYRGGQGTWLRQVREYGEELSRIDLPLGGHPSSAGGLPGADPLSGLAGVPELFVRWVGVTEPCVLLRADLTRSDPRLEVYLRPPLPFDPEAFESESEVVRGEGGDPIQLTFTRKKDLDPGAHHLVLHVVDPTADPTFEGRFVPFLEAGGELVTMRLPRGVGPLPLRDAGAAEAVRAAGDDVLAVADHIASEGRTTPSLLAVAADDLAGLVVAGAMLREPQLLGAVLLDDAPLDVLAARPPTPGVEPEVGDADELRAASPYQALSPGATLPAVLVSTSLDGTRAGDATRFVAALQHGQAGTHPVLLQVTEAAAPDAATVARRWATQLAFLEHVLE